MKITKLFLLGLPALAIISTFAVAKPAAAAPLQPMSVNLISAGRPMVVNYWHHHHWHHRHHHGGLVVRL